MKRKKQNNKITKVPQAMTLVNGGSDVNQGPVTLLPVQNYGKKAKKGERNNAGLQGQSIQTLTAGNAPPSSKKSQEYEPSEQFIQSRKTYLEASVGSKLTVVEQEIVMQQIPSSKGLGGASQSRQDRGQGQHTDNLISARTGKYQVDGTDRSHFGPGEIRLESKKLSMHSDVRSEHVLKNVHSQETLPLSSADSAAQLAQETIEQPEQSQMGVTGIKIENTEYEGAHEAEASYATSFLSHHILKSISQTTTIQNVEIAGKSLMSIPHSNHSSKVVPQEATTSTVILLKKNQEEESPVQPIVHEIPTAPPSNTNTEGFNVVYLKTEDDGKTENMGEEMNKDPLQDQNSAITNVNIHTNKLDKSRQRKMPRRHQNSSVFSSVSEAQTFKRDTSASLFAENMSMEEILTQQAIDDYMQKKKRYMGETRFFDKGKISQIAETTQKRTDLVASILGNSREAQDIQRKFRKMAQVPQEQFSLKSFKVLTEDLRNNMAKPANVYKTNLDVNPTRQTKLMSIEDLVTILPTSAESNNRPEDHTRNETAAVESQQTEQVQEKLLALTDDVSKRQSAPTIPTLKMNTADDAVDGGSDGGEENTFLTNLVESNYISHPQMPSLPTIQSVQFNSSRQCEQTGEKGGEIALKIKLRKQTRDIAEDRNRNETQLMPLIEKINAGDQSNYQSMATLIRPTDGSMTSLLRNQSDLNHAKNMSQSSVKPYSRSSIQRQPSYLSFSLNRRDVFEPSSVKKRVLGHPSGIMHSKLESAFGRENRVLHEIYKKVEKFAKQKDKDFDDGSRVTYRNGIVDVYTKAKSQRESMMAAHHGRKRYNQKLQPIADTLEPPVIQSRNNSAKKQKERPSSQLQIGVKNVGQVGLMGSDEQSVMILGHIDGDVTSIDQSQPAKNSLASVDDKTKNNWLMTLGSGALNSTRQDFEKANSTLQKSLQPINDMKVFETSIIQNYQDNSVNRKIPMHKALIESQKKKQIQNQNQLMDYKNKQQLVSNLQVSKLISKDMNIFDPERTKKKEHLNGSQEQQTNSLLVNIKSLDPEATTNKVNLSERLETVSSVTDVPTTIGYSKVPPNSSVDSRAVEDYQIKVEVESKNTALQSLKQQQDQLVQDSLSHDLLHLANFQAALDNPQQMMRQPMEVAFVSPPQLPELYTNRESSDQSLTGRVQFDEQPNILMQTNSSRISTLRQEHIGLDLPPERHQLPRRKTQSIAGGKLTSLHSQSEISVRRDRSHLPRNSQNEYYHMQEQKKRSNHKLSKVLIRGKNILDQQSPQVERKGHHETQPISLQLKNMDIEGKHIETRNNSRSGPANISPKNASTTKILHVDTDAKSTDRQEPDTEVITRNNSFSMLHKNRNTQQQSMGVDSSAEKIAILPTGINDNYAGHQTADFGAPLKPSELNNQQTQAQFSSDPNNTFGESDVTTAIFNAFGKLGADLPNEDSYNQIVNNTTVFKKIISEEQQHSQQKVASKARQQIKTSIINFNSPVQNRQQNNSKKRKNKEKMMLALTKSPSVRTHEMDLNDQARNDINRLSGTTGLLEQTTPVYQVGLSPKIFKRGIQSINQVASETNLQRQRQPFIPKRQKFIAGSLGQTINNQDSSNNISQDYISSHEPVKMTQVNLSDYIINNQKKKKRTKRKHQSLGRSNQDAQQLDYNSGMLIDNPGQSSVFLQPSESQGTLIAQNPLSVGVINITLEEKKKKLQKQGAANIRTEKSEDRLDSSQKVLPPFYPKITPRVTISSVPLSSTQQGLSNTNRSNDSVKKYSITMAMPSHDYQMIQETTETPKRVINTKQISPFNNQQLTEKRLVLNEDANLAYVDRENITPQQRKNDKMSPKSSSPLRYITQSEMKSRQVIQLASKKDQLSSSQNIITPKSSIERLQLIGVPQPLLHAEVIQNEVLDALSNTYSQDILGQRHAATATKSAAKNPTATGTGTDKASAPGENPQ